jgi:hypothetical protein
MFASMTGYDWLMVFGAVVVAGIVARGFWKADKVKPDPSSDTNDPYGRY